MVLVRENLVLQRQEGAAGVDQVDAGQVVFASDLLSSQMLLHCHRQVGASLDSGIVGHEEHFSPMDEADASDDACGMGSTIIHAKGCQGRKLQEGGSSIDDSLDSFSWKHLSPAAMLLDRLTVAASLGLCDAALELVDKVFVDLLSNLRLFLPDVRQLEAGAGGARARPDALLGTVPYSDGINAALLTGAQSVSAIGLGRLVGSQGGGLGIRDQGIQNKQVLSRLDSLPIFHAHALHSSVGRRMDFGLQLHCREQHQDVPTLHFVTLLRADLDHRRFQRRSN
mmetsp:Transcript_43437/g.93053  ORF Transcript_43437/g.93053 Transcript_43437/m.93053 type:complete len:282 (+) Transcript_43437:1683-2528(+)